MDCNKTRYTKNYEDRLEKFAIGEYLSTRADQEAAENWTDRCEACGSWRLKPLAITLGQSLEVFKELFPDNLHVIDTTTQDLKESKKVIQEYEKKGGLLLTTQRGVELLNSKSDLTVVISLDAALSAPDINVEHASMRLLLDLLDQTNEQFILQTRLRDNQTIQDFLSGNMRRFNNRQAEERKKFDFPPFANQAKISIPLAQTSKYKILIDQITSQLKASSYPSSLPYLNLLVSRPSNSWPDEKVFTVLSNLPYELKAIVNPANLL